MENDNKDKSINKSTDPEKLQEIIRKLEADGEKQLNELKKTGNVNGDSLTNLMKNGEKEFVKRTGRRMTYAEMRQAYG